VKLHRKAYKLLSIIPRDRMSTEAETKMWKAPGKNRHTMYVQIPAEIVKDSQFPFTVDTTKAKVRIDAEKGVLVVERTKTGRK
jgi:hypothetical protein